VHVQLIALIDDATSRVWARFTEHDTTEENLRTLGDGCDATGVRCPLHDKNSIFRTAGSAAVSEQLRGEAGARSQFGRALGELRDRMDRGTKSAGERAHRAIVRDLQDRLVKEMRFGGNSLASKLRITFWKRASSRVGRAIHGGTVPSTQCPSTAGARTSPGRNPECARGPQGGRRSPVSWNAKRWACHGRKSALVYGSLGGNRTASGTARTGCASRNPLYCACAPVRNRAPRR